MSSSISDINLAFLDASDTIIEIVTYDSTTIHNTIAMADTFRSIGYPADQGALPRQPRRQPGRHRARRPAPGARPRPRVPRRVRRPARRRARTTRACRSSSPTRRAGQPGHRPGRDRSCSAPRGCRSPPGAASATRVRPATDRRLRLRGRRPDRPARDPPPDPARVDDLPRRQRPRAVRPARPTTRSCASRPRPRRARRARRQGHRRRLQHLDGGRPRRLPAPLRRCPSWASSGPGASAAALATRNRRVGVIATPATIRSHAYFEAIKDENPAIEVYEHATPTLVPMVEAGLLTGAEARGDGGRARSRRCSASATRTASRSSRCRPARAIDTLLLGCTHYPLLRAASSRAVVGDRRRHRRLGDGHRLARWPSCSSINGLEAPGTTRGTAADAGRPARPADEVARRPPIAS